MTKKNYLFFLAIFFFVLILVIYSINFYFLSRLSISNNSSNRLRFAGDISDNLNRDESSLKLKSLYKEKNPKFSQIKEKLVRNFKPCNRTMSYVQLWKEVDMWSMETTNEIYPLFSPLMCQLVTAMKQVSLLSARNSKRGTQFKMNFTVEGDKNMIFKPRWYTRSEVMDGEEVYSGKDRHNSEIVAFYLGALLNFRWTSIAVGRAVSIRDVFDIADKELQETIVSKRNGTKLCVYGKCFYCTPSESVCGNKTHFIEGVLLYEINGTINKHKSPWQRTYKENQKAIWESDNNYCDNVVKQKFSSTRLLDLIDASVFDFLIQNGDRHHYETRKNRIILLDNGKGFGNPHVDFSDILAPLYQCCIIRKSTYARLLLFTGGSLTEILKELTKFDDLYPILTDFHYHAIERRLLKLFSMIEFCRSKFGNGIFQ